MDMFPVYSATPECLRLGTDEVVVLATSDQTAGALFAVEIRMPPGLKLIGHVKTSATGTFVARAPAGPSRTIVVAYRAFSGDGAYAATARIIESVDAGIQLGISPRRTGSEGAITLTGHVLGPVPPQGVSVDLLGQCVDLAERGDDGVRFVLAQIAHEFAVRTWPNT